MKYLLSLIITIISFSSCVSTNPITIQVRQPAMVSFPPEVTKILIVDNCVVKPKKESAEESTAILSTDSATSIMLNSFTQFMNEENYFSNVSLYPYKTGMRGTDEMVPLSAREVESICMDKDADALVAVDLFAMSVDLETEDTGYFSSYSLLKGQVGAVISVYSKDGSQYVEPIMYLDSLFREESSDWSRLKQNVSEINTLITDLSITTADKLTSKVIPSWKTEDRWYYSDNSSNMKEAATSVKYGRWQEALDTWTMLYEKESDITKKIRLASNIALAKESLDEVKDALEWITKAYNMLPDKSNSYLAEQVLYYKNVLALRVANMPKLNTQLGIEDSPLEE